MSIYVEDLSDGVQIKCTTPAECNQVIKYLEEQGSEGNIIEESQVDENMVIPYIEFQEEMLNVSGTIGKTDRNLQLKKATVELANILDERGLTAEANALDEMLEDFNQADKEVAEVKDDKDDKDDDDTTSDEDSKLTNKQKSALKALYKAAVRVIETVSVGSKQFPDKDKRRKITTVIQCLEDALDCLEEFAEDEGAITEKDIEKREEASDKAEETNKE